MRELSLSNGCMHSTKLRQKPKIDIHVLSVRINALTSCCTESTRGRHCARTSWSRSQSDVELQSSCLRLHVIRSALPTGIWYVHVLHTLTNAARSLTLSTSSPSATASTREHRRLLVNHPRCYRWVGHVSSMYTHKILTPSSPAGPVAVVVVPPIRKSMGWQPTERIPTTFPRKLCLSCACDRSSLTALPHTVPQRAREEITGYDDE
jgi:hypothetical protein